LQWSYGFEGIVFGFLILDDVLWCHSMLFRFVSGSRRWEQLSLLVTMLRRQSSSVTA
jgi:hypothetical protein